MAGAAPMIASTSAIGDASLPPLRRPREPLALVLASPLASAAPPLLLVAGALELLAASPAAPLSLPSSSPSSEKTESDSALPNSVLASEQASSNSSASAGRLAPLLAAAAAAAALRARCCGEGGLGFGEEVRNGWRH